MDTKDRVYCLMRLFNTDTREEREELVSVHCTYDSALKELNRRRGLYRIAPMEVK
jgi:hypothetical protein